jgi:hypothetical protein
MSADAATRRPAATRFWNKALRLGLLPRRWVTLEVAGRARPVRLVLVPVGERAAVIKRYVEKVPGARPHIPVDRHEPVAAFETIAADFPVFQVVPMSSPD